MITVREGDKVNRISTIEAVHRAQSAAALKGSTYARSTSSKPILGPSRHGKDEIRESNEWWSGYVRTQRDAPVHAIRNGLPVP